MDELQRPLPVRIVERLLPREFVRRVVDPAWEDLRAHRLRSGLGTADLWAGVRFAAHCLVPALQYELIRIRRPRWVAWCLLAAFVAFVIVRERMAYGPR